MESNSASGGNSIINTTSRFNVVVRIKPELGDEKTDLTTDDDMLPCVTKLVK
jgi:hypothetical protein